MHIACGVGPLGEGTRGSYDVERFSGCLEFNASAIPQLLSVLHRGKGTEDRF